MKSIFKITVALLGAIAVLSPTNAQDTNAEEKTPPSTVSLLKSMFLGTGAESAFKANTETKYLFNVTDANYKDILFNEECIINFCSSSNLHCAEYYEHYLEAAETLGDDSPAKFVTVWVDETPLISARFFVPARLPYVLYAKEGEFHWIPYRLNDTKFLVEFVEEEKYQLYPILNGITAPNGRLAQWFEKYATASEWVGQYTSWMPRWMILMIAGSMSGMIFQFFSGGSAYASDPARYPHLNQDGTPKKTEEPKEKKKKKSDESSKDDKVKKSKKSSSSSEQTTKTKKKTKKTKSE